MIFHLRHLKTAALIHSYETEGAALAFVRDIVRFGSREAAAQFRLTRTDAPGRTTTVAEGEALV